MPDKRFQLLAYLAYQGDWVRREHASFLFWSDEYPQAARENLRSLLKRVRHLRVAEIESDRHRLRWSVKTDVAAFKEAVARDDLDEALALYRGPLLQDLDGDDASEFGSWLELERERLGGVWRERVSVRGRGLEQQGRYEEAAHLYRRALEQDELDEEALTAFLRAALHAGDREQALRTYRSFADRLERELELEPSSATEHLARSIHEAETAVAPTTSPPTTAIAKALRRVPRLPSSATSFIGRDLELAEVADLLGDQDRRLVTLTGAGGVGKSRIALRVAGELSPRHEGGVYWVSLESPTRAAFLASQIAQGLNIGLHGHEDPLVRLSDSLRSRRTLLVLDNFEHVLKGAPLVSDLVRQCPCLKILVTSREALCVPEEWRLPVEGLPVPGDDTIALDDALRYDAVQLFGERAKRVQPRFSIRQDNLPHVLSICRLAGGFPVAIELASVWVKMLSCAEIASEIEKNLDFLTAPLRNVADRHQSIRATFEHSWSLLTPREQAVLRKLAVFSGGFRLEAAKHVAAAPLPMLASLVDKSLLRRAADGRYDHQPLLHQYAREKLAQHPGEQHEVQCRHLEYYVTLAEQAEPKLTGAPSARWLDHLERERENLGSACHYAEANERADLGMRLGGALNLYGHAREPRSE